MSREDANLKVRLARLRIEAEENAKVRRAEFEFQLEIRRLEIQADKEVQLCRLELEEGKLSSGSAGQAATLGSVSRDSAVCKAWVNCSKASWNILSGPYRTYFSPCLAVLFTSVFLILSMIKTV